MVSKSRKSLDNSRHPTLLDEHVRLLNPNADDDIDNEDGD